MVAAEQQLLLCSAGLGAMPAWIDRHASDPVVTFVDAAAQPLGLPSFVGECRHALERAGSVVEDLDLCRATEPEVALVLDRADMVFVVGGYPIFLLEWAQRSGFLREARQRVGGGRLIYAGVSAGAALASPSMEPLAAADDPGRVTDFQGLELVDFVVIPHVNRYPATVFDERRRECTVGSTWCHCPTTRR